MGLLFSFLFEKATTSATGLLKPGLSFLSKMSMGGTFLYRPSWLRKEAALASLLGRSRFPYSKHHLKTCFYRCSQPGPVNLQPAPLVFDLPR